MVGLPRLIGGCGLVATEQVEGLFVGLGPVVRQRDQRGVEPAHDRVDAIIAGHRPALCAGHGRGLAVDAGYAGRRAAQGQALDQADQRIRQMMTPSVAARPTHQAGQTMLPILPHPIPRGAQGEGVRPRDGGERHAVLQEGAQDLEPLQRLLALLLTQGREGRVVDHRQKPST